MLSVRDIRYADVASVVRYALPKQIWGFAAARGTSMNIRKAAIRNEVAKEAQAVFQKRKEVAQGCPPAKGQKRTERPGDFYYACIFAWNAYRKGKTTTDIKKFDQEKG